MPTTTFETFPFLEEFVPDYATCPVSRPQWPADARAARGTAGFGPRTVV